MTKKAWKLRTSSGISLRDQLLAGRGVAAEEQASFLMPDYALAIHDPFLLTDMEVAVERLLRAIRLDERLAVFADYDADGVPAAAILVSFFRKIGFNNFEVYIPDRHEENHGLSDVAIRSLADRGVKLIVTVDCGIANAESVATAATWGVEIIITDHHLIPASGWPEAAVAVVDPKRDLGKYPSPDLCGAGVAFKLVQALIARGNFNLPTGWEKWLLDLVAIATVSDMVPLVGENRALVRYGLIVLRKSPRAGVQALCRVLNLTQESLSEDDIAFSLGPRINAASRMAHGSQALELLTTSDLARARALAEELERYNKQRRVLVDRILLATKAVDESSPVVVAGDAGWSLGVLGLAASRLVEKFERPVFLWGQNSQGLIKGSCRSDGSVGVVDLMEAAGGADYFSNHGGHLQAGGFALAAERVAELPVRLQMAYQAVPKQLVESELWLDAELSLMEVDEVVYAHVEALAPFGMNNPKPVFLFSGVPISTLRIMKGGLHLELGLPGRHGLLSAFSFFNSFPELGLRSGDRIDLAATIEKSYFRRYPELRLRIVDLRRA